MYYECICPSCYCLFHGFECYSCCSRRSSRIKDNPVKIPKKIHKAEREKLKRNDLNVLFLELNNTLGNLVLISLLLLHQMHSPKLICDAWSIHFKLIVPNLFLPLVYLEPAHQNNGKASLLSNATRLLRDLLCQIDSLKEENTSLLSESHYVSFLKFQPVFSSNLIFFFPRNIGQKCPTICFKENMMFISTYEYPLFFSCYQCYMDSGMGIGCGYVF